MYLLIKKIFLDKKSSLRIVFNLFAQPLCVIGPTNPKISVQCLNIYVLTNMSHNEKQTYDS